jgi:hypothetical protein
MVGASLPTQAAFRFSPFFRRNCHYSDDYPQYFQEKVKKSVRFSPARKGKYSL